MTTVVPATRAVPDRLLTRGFVLLAVGELCYFTSDGIAIYLVPVHATGPLGAGAAGAGVAFGAFALSALLLRPWAGRTSDRRGRRPLLLAGAALAALSLAATAHAGTLGAMVGLRLVAGIAEAAFFVAAFAALVDLAPPARLGEALSYNSLALYVGIAGGPPLGELLVRSHGFAAGWYGAGVLASASALVLVALAETHPGPLAAEAGRAPLVHRRSLPVALAFLASVVAMGGFLAFVALRAGEVGLTRTSLPLVVYGSVVVLGRLAFAKVPDRVPSLPLGAAALCLIAGGLLVTVGWHTPTGLVAGTGVLALGVTFSTPAFFSAIFATARPDERGAASATASVSIDLGLGLGPILLGLVAADAGIPSAFALAAGVALAGAAWTWSLLRRQSSRAIASVNGTALSATTSR